MAAISPENLDGNTDSDVPPKSLDLLENTVNLNTNYKEKYIGDFVECIDSLYDNKKLYYPYDLFVRSLDAMALYRPNSNYEIPLYTGKDVILPKLSYGHQVSVKLRNHGEKDGMDLALYFFNNQMRGEVLLTKYSGELDITLDKDGNKVYTLKKINSFIERICDKFGKCFSRSKQPPAGGSKKRAKKTRKQRKPRKSKRNHKK